MKKLKEISLKIIALFSVVKGYNLLFLTISQYFSAVFILAKNQKWWFTLQDFNLHWIVLATIFSVFSGYIINQFYDAEKDKLNKPIQAFINEQISKKFKLNIYILGNFISLILALLVSNRAAFFFLFYQFLLWFYSHKISKIVILNNIFNVVLILFPFFGILIYYGNYHLSIIYHAWYLFSILWLYDILKDLNTLKGDVIYNYQTIPVVFGEKLTRCFTSFLAFILAIGSFFIYLKLGNILMRYYFLISGLGMVFIVISLLSTHKQNYLMVIRWFVKIILYIGVLSLVLIGKENVTLQKIFT